MPITLRSPNNPFTAKMILGIVRSIINLDVAGQPCTYLASIDPNTPQTGLSLVYVQNKYKMALAMTAALPYAVHLSAGPQRFVKSGGPRAYEGSMQMILEYCARWDEQQASIDSIRQTEDDDIERMKANLESNDDIVYGGTGYAMATPQIALSPYKGTLNTDIQGLTLVERVMTAQIAILAYDTLS